MIASRLQAWLSRSSQPRGTSQVDDLPVFLGTDVGLHRSENQDVVIFARIGSRESAPTLFALVADGMGGMVDGRICACLAVASFVSVFAHEKHLDLAARLAVALKQANDDVFEYSQGRGGSTIAAIAIQPNHDPVFGYVGDSRIYGLRRGERTEIIRLTIDDSLEEAFGGHGRGLLNFLGMGQGLVPHVAPLPTDVDSVFLSTDGVHFIYPSVFESILAEAPGVKSIIERSLALARWCGGPDNASAIALDFSNNALLSASCAKDGIEIWDPFSKLEVIYVNSKAPPETVRLVLSAGDKKNERRLVGDPNKPEEIGEGADAPQEVYQKRRARKPRISKDKETSDAIPQLTIQVDTGSD
jgi:serine/threonine protein phosphatase PrpC